MWQNVTWPWAFISEAVQFKREAPYSDTKRHTSHTIIITLAHQAADNITAQSSVFKVFVTYYYIHYNAGDCSCSALSWNRAARCKITPLMTSKTLTSICILSPSPRGSFSHHLLHISKDKPMVGQFVMCEFELPVITNDIVQSASYAELKLARQWGGWGALIEHVTAG